MAQPQKKREEDQGVGCSGPPEVQIDRDLSTLSLKTLPPAKQGDRAALPSSHVYRRTPVFYDYDFELERGHERPPLDVSNTHIPLFLGYCYFCDCPKHSQNYCPLRYCQACYAYGHSTRVCPKHSAQGNGNWRQSDVEGRARPVRRTLTRHRFHHHHAVPFGSTWTRRYVPVGTTAESWRSVVDATLPALKTNGPTDPPLDMVCPDALKRPPEGVDEDTSARTETP